MGHVIQAAYNKLLARVTLLGSVVLTYGNPAMAQSKDAAASGISSAITTAAITGLVGGVGWIAAYVLNSQREDRTKRLQLTIEHTSTQMREFYGPLVALTDQLNTMASVKTEAVRGKSQEVNYDLTATFYDKFFLPIHEEINAILKTKVHLLEGATTPPSFVRYFEHYASEKAYWQLVQAGKDVRDMKVPEYPSKFYYDVRRGYQAVLDRYEQSLEEMRHPRMGLLLKPYSSSSTMAVSTSEPEPDTSSLAPGPSASPAPDIPAAAADVVKPGRESRRPAPNPRPIARPMINGDSVFDN